MQQYSQQHMRGSGRQCRVVLGWAGLHSGASGGAAPPPTACAGCPALLPSDTCPPASDPCPLPPARALPSLQWRPLHLGSPYLEDYYFQAFMYKYYAKRNRRSFAPESGELSWLPGWQGASQLATQGRCPAALPRECSWLPAFASSPN